MNKPISKTFIGVMILISLMFGSIVDEMLGRTLDPGITLTLILLGCAFIVTGLVERK